jgi:tetratricopeptide (TPR) repeat protein
VRISELSTSGPGRGFTQVRPSLRVAILTTILLVVVPLTASAQKETFVEALVAMTEALSGDYGDEGARVRAALDTMARSLTEWDRSLREYEQNLASRLPTATSQNALEMHTAMGGLYLERGRVSDAVREFEAASRIAPDRAALHMVQGLVHRAANDPRVALQSFRRAWELDPDDPVKAYLVAESAIEYSSTDEAALLLARMSAILRLIATQERSLKGAPFIDVSLVLDGASGSPLFGPAAYQTAYALIEQSSFDAALAALRSAVAVDRLTAAPVTARMTQGAEALRGGRILEATSHFAAEIAAQPQSSEAHRMMGVACWAAAEYDKSIEYLEQAIRLNQADERARVALARVFAEAGQPGRAQQTLIDAVQVLPASALAHIRLGRMYAAAARNQEAIAELEAAAKLSALAGKASLYREIGVLHARESNFDAAVEAFSNLTRIAPNDGFAHRERGRALLLQGRRDHAFVAFVAALLANPNDPDAYLAIGQIHLAAERYPDAVLVLERAVALNGDSAEARYALGTALVRSGQRDAGARHLAEFQRLQAQAVEDRRRQIDVAVLKLEAGERTREGAHQQAVTLWQAIVAAQPGVAVNHVELAAALARNGQTDAAIEQYEQALTLDAEPGTYRQLAALYEKIGRLDESARIRTRLLQTQQEALRSGNLPR